MQFGFNKNTSLRSFAQNIKIPTTHLSLACLVNLGLMSLDILKLQMNSLILKLSFSAEQILKNSKYTSFDHLNKVRKQNFITLFRGVCENDRRNKTGNYGPRPDSSGRFNQAAYSLR